MGYEVTYKFYPKKDIGYDVDAPDSFVKNIGKTEEVPVEKLANAIMMQLARRDIMVFDVEILETVKRKVSFKETKGGVLIKNKKFMLDGSVEIVETEPDEPRYESPVYERKQNQALRWEIYDPHPTMVSISRKFKLTPKRKYPVLEENTVIQKANIQGGTTEISTLEYVTIDDTGNKIRVSSALFTPEQKALIGMEMMDTYEMPTLTHMGGGDIAMPVLRR